MSKSETEPLPSRRTQMPPVPENSAFSLVPSAFFRVPTPDAEATLNEYALGPPICGSPRRLKRIRNIAPASVAVRSEERRVGKGGGARWRTECEQRKRGCDGYE